MNLLKILYGGNKNEINEKKNKSNLSFVILIIILFCISFSFAYIIYQKNISSQPSSQTSSQPSSQTSSQPSSQTQFNLPFNLFTMNNTTSPPVESTYSVNPETNSAIDNVKQNITTSTLNSINTETPKTTPTSHPLTPNVNTQINENGLLINPYGKYIDFSGNVLHTNNLYGYNVNNKIVNSNGVEVSNIKIDNGYMLNNNNFIINTNGNLIDLSDNVIINNGIYGYNSNGYVMTTTGSVAPDRNIKIDRNGKLINQYDLLVNINGRLTDISNNLLSGNSIIGYKADGNLYSTVGDRMDWINFGCFNVNPLIQSIPSFRGSNMSFNQCKQIALNNNDTIIGLQNGSDSNVTSGDCFTGKPTNSFYAKYGKATSCGTFGGTNINNVYGLINTTKQWTNKGCFNENLNNTRIITVPSGDPVTQNYVSTSGNNAYANLGTNNTVNNCKYMAQIYGYDLAAVQAGAACMVGNKSINYSINGAASSCPTNGAGAANVNNIYIIE